MMTAPQINPGDTFDLEEAFGLINRTVVEKSSESDRERGMAAIGLVVGVLTLNLEVEIVVKFFDRVAQFTKSEFIQQIEAMSHDDGL